MLLWLIFGCLLFHSSNSLPGKLRVLGLFEESKQDTSTEVAMKYAIYKINQERIIDNTILNYDVAHLPAGDTFQAVKRACHEISLGVVAVCGPISPELSMHVESLCNALEIPHIEIRWDDRVNVAPFSINLYPESSQLSTAYVDLVRYYRWSRMAIFYENDAGLMRLQGVVKAQINNVTEIFIRQIRPEDVRVVLKEARKRQIIHYLIDLEEESIMIFLRTALQMGMISSKYHYVFTSLDFPAFELEDYQYNGVNMTIFSILDNDNPYVRGIISEMAAYSSTQNKLLTPTGTIKVEAALMFDAIYVLAHALRELDRSSPIRMANLSCESEVAWSYGSSLYNYLNLVEMQGLTGRIRFDEGKRFEFELDILQLTEGGLVKTGSWAPVQGVNFTLQLSFNDTTKTGNKTIIVTSILEAPYVMTKKSDHLLQGNDRYEGFCIDLIEEISQVVGFSYVINLVPDGNYGSKSATGEWNGMVKDLLDRRADIAVASLTISSVRSEAIDFTKPFMNTGISILFKVPKGEKPGLFSFLNPLSIQIWLYTIASYLVVSFTLFVLARFSPYEWHNPHPCNAESEYVENKFSMANSLWFAVGTLMQQGSDINPRAISTRIVGGLWWFFTLIIISSYTANLAAFLTVEKMVSPIENADDLSRQTEISFGTRSSGSTMTFFQTSKIDTYSRMWRYMESKRPTVFTKTSEEGIQRVLQGNYAYLMESSMIAYITQRNCNLTQIGGLLDSKGYGIGTQRGSPYRDPISLAILQLQENGKIQMLYNKWWKNMGSCHGDEKKKDSKANALGVENVGGIFVVLLAGLALSVIVALFEFIWFSKRSARADRVRGPVKQSLCTEMAEELRFAIRCHGSTKKPAIRNRRCSRCPVPDVAGEAPNGLVLVEVTRDGLKELHR